jgi:AraC-like DNA-binding protein
MTVGFIAMTRASGIGPLPRLLDEMCGGKAVEQVFRSVQLPVEILEDPGAEMPLGAMMELFDGAARRAGDHLFGLRVGMAMAPLSYGSWVAYAMSAATLGEALQRLCRTIVLHQPHGRLLLGTARGTGTTTAAASDAGALAVWTYIAPQVGQVPQAQHADHILPVMIAVCRRYLGLDWLPLRVRMNYPDPGDSARRSALLALNWSFDGPGVSLTFPAALLATPRPFAVAREAQFSTSVDLAAQLAGRTTQTLEEAVEAIVTLRLLDGRADIDGVARLAGTSVRSLQRRLSESGTSYSALLNRVRERKARALLRETDLSVTGIALSLGYSDPANFTRAFVRRTGTAPQQFRASQRG